MSGAGDQGRAGEWFPALDRMRTRARLATLRRRRGVLRAIDARRRPDSRDDVLGAGALPLPRVRCTAPAAQVSGHIAALRTHCGDQPFAGLDADPRAAHPEDPRSLYALLRGVAEQFAAVRPAPPGATPLTRLRRLTTRGPRPPVFSRFDSLRPLLGSGGGRTVDWDALAEERTEPPGGGAPAQTYRALPFSLERSLRVVSELDGATGVRRSMLEFYRTRIFALVRAPFAEFDARLLTPLSTGVNAAAVLFLGAGVSNVPGVGLLEPVASAVLLILLLLYHLLAYLAWTRPWSRFRWLAAQPYLADDPRTSRPSGVTKDDPALHRHHRVVFGVINSTLALRACGRPPDRGGTGRREELLDLIVNAFLHDLYAADRRRAWFRRYGRTHYPVLAVRYSGAARAHRLLVERIERIRGEQLWPDPLLIVEFAEDGAPAEAVPADPAPAPADGSLTQRFEEWRADRRDHGHLGARVLDGGRLTTVPRAEPPQPTAVPTVHYQAARLLAWTAAATAAVLAMGSVVVAAGQGSSPCWAGQRMLHQGVALIGTDCVGLTDGSFTFHPRLASVQDRIAEQNADVLGSDGPYVDIAYVGALSVTDDDQQSDLLAGVHGELAGLAVKQADYNSAAGRHGYARIRLVLVNAGPALRHGAEVAGMVAEEAARNPRLLAAVGFGQSRKETGDAIAVLTEAGLPMVGTTPTFDDIGRIPGDGKRSAYFFPIAPANSRIATQAARWARSGSPASDGVDHPLPARATAAALASDAPGELYGVDLARTFMAEFTANGGRTAVPAGENGPGVLRYTDAESLKDRIDTICRDAPDVIYYGGRSDEFGIFFERLQDRDTCAEGVTVIGSDDIAKYVTDHVAELGDAADFPVYYTPLAASDTWGLGSGKREKGFYRKFKRLGGSLGWTGGRPREEPSVAHAVMAYDALSITANAVGDAQDMQSGGGAGPKTLPTSILTPLSQVSKVAGVSGAIEFGGIGTDGNWISDRMVQLVRAGPGGTQHPVAVCGRVSNKDVRDTGVCR
ncbi:ABC-type branched-subunit amino acid transport system substrate-binding protein [Murinocardiopsis flavida]|uniref:ABC-type branched-subunit amino acid transport system substrate-binding protein n=1 Tax=Murinocardiopsis flavida TaxID=645275 RepID=A0A2P8DR47_9ACTN|nr:ABC transporter substrate-binding protein [Murinocardiopsis flavida]PSK99687.1 ABC-type branched-subunit amino acid transport system substrate-binding protein [Murinocardiopsis flavida]